MITVHVETPQKNTRLGDTPLNFAIKFQKFNLWPTVHYQGLFLKKMISWTMSLFRLLGFFVIIPFICAKEEATLGEFPWTVSLRLDGLLGHDCGGAILNESWILTTAYCADLNDQLDHANFVVV